MSGSIDLKLEGFCIETAARRALRDLADRLMAGDEQSENDLSGPIELLHAFLEAGGFGCLRAERPELDGNWDVNVRIRHNGERFEIDLLDQPRRHED
jgi:hypothetical protein